MLSFLCAVFIKNSKYSVSEICHFSYIFNVALKCIQHENMKDVQYNVNTDNVYICGMSFGSDGASSNFAVTIQLFNPLLLS